MPLNSEFARPKPVPARSLRNVMGLEVDRSLIHVQESDDDSVKSSSSQDQRDYGGQNPFLSSLDQKVRVKWCKVVLFEDINKFACLCVVFFPPSLLLDPSISYLILRKNHF